VTVPSVPTPPTNPVQPATELFKRAPGGGTAYLKAEETAVTEADLADWERDFYTELLAPEGPS
jgi:hypothetical protein